MKRLATTTRRRSDEIKAKEREAIGPRRTESIDQHNRRKTPERNRCRLREEMRRGDKSRIAPSKRARATGGKSRLYSSKRPYYTGDRVTEKKSATGIGASSHHLPPKTITSGGKLNGKTKTEGNYNKENDRCVQGVK
ncbi:hypothetical protein Bca4012_047787 [Brassica carinata]